MREALGGAGRRTGHRRIAGAALVLLLLAAVPAAGGPGIDAAGAAVSRLGGAEPWTTSVAASRATLGRATTAVVARLGPTAAAAAPLATALGAPLLLVPPRGIPEVVVVELRRLGVTEVVLVGAPSEVSRATEAELRTVVRVVARVAGPTLTATAAAVARRLPPSPRAVVVPADDLALAAAGAAFAARSALPLLLAEGGGLPPDTARVLDDRRVSEVVAVGVLSEAAVAAQRQRGRTVVPLVGLDRWETAGLVHDAQVAAGAPRDRLWLAAGAAAGLAGAVAAPRAGATVLRVDGVDLRGPASTAARLRAARSGLRQLVLHGDVRGDDTAVSAQLRTVLVGSALPGGGHRLLPDRRLVAFYGSGTDARLGTLGEGSPEEAAARLRTVAAAYETPARPVLPVLELIATTAQAGPGSDGDHSAPAPRAVVERYLEAAHEAEALLLLDLQPGRQDFLTDLRRFDDLLADPAVGVALDPEWRVGPDGVPGEAVGTVDAEEVLRVARHLAEIVRRHDLPEKVLVVHRFTEGMLTRAERLVAPDGVEIVIDADGIGDPDAKRRAYARWTTGDAAHDGIMLFLDQDQPRTLGASEVLALQPEVDLVAYQ